MKVQIRRNVFETNSSSVHTLSICKDPVNIEKYAGSTFKFGMSWTERNNKLQEKLDAIFFYMVSNDSLSNFIRCKNMIEKVFSKYEIKCEFLIDENGEYEFEAEEEVLDNLFDPNNTEFESDLICFIFNDKSKTDYFNNNYFDTDKDLPKGNFKNYFENC